MMQKQQDVLQNILGDFHRMVSVSRSIPDPGTLTLQESLGSYILSVTEQCLLNDLEF